MSHWISPAGQIRALAGAVSAAFAASNLEPEEKNPGRIEITDLPWQAPPLIAPLLINGAPLQDYLDSPIPLDERTLMEFWVETDKQMWFTPSRLLRRGVLANCGKYMPKVKVGQRALRFSRPAGYPAFLQEDAGIVLALEVAHAALTSLPISELVSDDNNYYVTLFGQVYGVKDGLPAIDSHWKQPATDMVQDLLIMPRGDTSYDCQFDQIASLRSVLHVHQKRFPRNFNAIDQALQALRLLTFGTYCPELVKSMHVAPLDLVRVREIERLLSDAIGTMTDDTLSDRSKLHVLHGLLVPSVLSAGKFKQHVFAGSPFPFTLAEGKAEKITTWLRQEYNTRVPSEQRKLKETS
jgi:hypothetical protein